MHEISQKTFGTKITKINQIPSFIFRVIECCFFVIDFLLQCYELNQIMQKLN